MSNKKLYLITFVRDGKECVEEVPAYSRDQAKYLASCSMDEIVDVTVSVSHATICC